MDLTRYDDKALALLSSIQQDIAAMRWMRAWTAPAVRREAEQALRRARALRREINRREHKGKGHGECT
jgi:hypothetical protein